MNRFTLSHLALGLLLASLAVGAQAAEVTRVTDTVKGRAPVVENVVISNQSYPAAVGARIGHRLSAGYSFSDADGDADSGTVFQWLRNGVAINGATANTYTTQSADASRELSVAITPKTDPSVTDPESGIAVTSTAVTVTTGAIGVGNFLAPLTTLRNWNQANSYCQSQGARLPTKDELQQLFVDATSSPTFHPNSGYVANTEMCALYGWPLGGLCGGTGDIYWAGDPTTGTMRYTVSLKFGSAAADYTTNVNNTYQVVCVR